MDKKTQQSRLLLASCIILAGAMLRLAPHWPNFTPIAAMALFGGTYLRRKELAFLVPVFVMLLSDAILGFHQTMFAVYGSFIAIVALGFLLRQKISMLNIASASLVSSTLFYLVTNFASWQTGMMPYAPDASGLMQSYIMGLPFFLNGILGDIFYNGIFFGAFYLVANRKPVAGLSR